MNADLISIWITIKLAGLTTLILLVVGTPVAWWLSQTKFRFKFIIESFIALPLVLPPTVLGFYLLIAIGPEGMIGRLMDSLGAEPLAFSFSGLVLGSVLYSLPFVVQPLQASFCGIGKKPLEVAATLGASPIDRFFSIVVPMARPGFLTAAALGFAHTLGEFGVVLMIGGNIPGKTQVASIAIYNHVESMEYDQAHWISVILFILSFFLLTGTSLVNRRLTVRSS